MSHLREVRLYGVLGQRFGRVHHFAIASPAEALAALRANYHEIVSAMQGMGVSIFVDFDELRMDQLTHPTGREVIRIVPIVAGSGTIIGDIIMYIAYAWAEIGAVGQFIVSSVAYSAAASLLSPSPSMASATSDRPENQASYAFNGAINTSAQGNAIPLCYGRVMVGSQVLFAGMGVEQLL